MKTSLLNSKKIALSVLTGAAILIVVDFLVMPRTKPRWNLSLDLHSNAFTLSGKKKKDPRNS